VQADRSLCVSEQQETAVVRNGMRAEHKAVSEEIVCSRTQCVCCGPVAGTGRTRRRLAAPTPDMGTSASPPPPPPFFFLFLSKNHPFKDLNLLEKVKREGGEIRRSRTPCGVLWAVSGTGRDQGRVAGTNPYLGPKPPPPPPPRCFLLIILKMHPVEICNCLRNVTGEWRAFIVRRFVICCRLQMLFGGPNERRSAGHVA